MGKVNLDKVREFQERLQGIQSGFWVPKVGTNQIRIMPPVGDSDLFFTEVVIHFLPGDAPIRCLRSVGKKCPICDLVDELRKKEENPKQLELSRRLAAKRRFLYYVVDLDDPETGVQVYSSGIKVMQQITAYFADPEWGDLTDPEKGYDIILERMGTGLSTTYSIRPKKTPSPLPKKYLAEPLKPLEEVIPVVETSEVKERLIKFIQRLKEDPSLGTFEEKPEEVSVPVKETPKEAPKEEVKTEPEVKNEDTEEVDMDIINELTSLEELK